MSLSSEVSRNEFVGNGAATSFPITFSFFKAGDLKVIKRLLDGTQVVLTGSDFTISGTNLVLPAALPNGVKLFVIRDLDFTQETEFRNQGEIYLEVVEDTFDRVVMSTQQLKEKSLRALSLAESTKAFDPTLPPDIDTVPGATIVVNATATGFKTGPTATEIANAQTYAANALASQNAAGTSEANAATSEANALASETAAAASAASALASKNAAQVSETNAATYASNALSSKNAAQTSATNAATSEGAASSAATTASTAATNAGNSATAAATSETNAAQSATDAAAARATIVANSTVDSATTGSDKTLPVPTTLVVELTAAVTSIVGIVAPANKQALILMNKTGADIVFKNQNATATAANRIIMGTGSDITFKSDASLWLIYDTNSSRWRVIGGSGGSNAIESALQSLAASASMSIDLFSTIQTLLVQGSGGAVVLSTTPFGASAPQKATVLKVVGNSDTNTITIPANDAAKGVLGYEVTLGRGQTATYEYNSILDRYLIIGTSN